MIALLPPTASMAINLTQPFSGVGGTGPYSYSIVSGSGSIDPVTGLYTSPSSLPLASDPPIVVRVTDSLLATAQSTIFVLSPLDLVCDILQTVLALPPGRVWIWDQKVNEPTDSDLFIVVQMLVPKFFGGSSKPVAQLGSLIQSQTTNVSATISIDLKSRNTQALDRLEEAVMAFSANYSEAQQELNNFRLFPLPNSVVNLSELDGAAIPYRFNISAVLQYAVSKSTNIPYYDTFASPTLDVNP